MALSLGAPKRNDLPAGDYVSDGLAIVAPDECFPNMVIGDKTDHPWPYLRREVGHNWYCDRREPLIGFLNRDEAVLLHNLALQFRGRPALEIGSWMGWSTCHLALAGLELDVIDPALANLDIADSVRSSLAAAGVLGNVHLHPTASPGGIRELARSKGGGTWNLFFVDGEHDGAGPERDVRECLEYAAPDALFVFHDLVAPDVAEGLRTLWRQGWHVLIYQTMQIVGIAWRGQARPVDHQPDPSINWSLPPHLFRYPVAGSSPAENLNRLSIAMGWSDGEIVGLQDALTTASADVARLNSDIVARDIAIKELTASVAEGRARQLEVDSSEPEPSADTHDLIAESGWFDTAYYAAQSPAIEGSRPDPIQHYIVSGAGDGMDPHPLFDTSFYLEMYPDVRAAGMNPLAHYLMSGAAEGRASHPTIPRRELFFPTDTHALIAGSGLFDSAFYAGQSRAFEAGGIDPIRHYIASGAGEGLDPHPLFDTSFYLDTNPDVRAAGINPLAHYLLTGAAEMRDPHPLFDTSFHRESNPDVVAAGLNPLAHYIQNGAVEDRDPHPLFDNSFYLDQKPHLKGLGINPLVHFLGEGPTADFDPLSSAPALPDTGICIVTPDIVGPVKNGGIGTASFHFARVLVAAGHSVSVLLTSEVTDCQRAHWRNAYARIGIKFIALSETPPVTRPVYGSTSFFERSWRVFEYLRHAHYTIVHFQDWQANGFWSIKAKRVGLSFDQTTLTVMTHSCTKWINEGMREFSANAFETAKLMWAESYCIERCDLLLSPSRYMLEWVNGNHIVAPPRRRLTPYAWADRPAGAPARSPVDNHHLIFFGRLETRKGLHLFADALRRLQRDDGDALPRVVSFLGKHARVLGRPSADVLEELRRDLPTVEIRVINHFDYAQAMDYIRESRGLVVLPSILDNYPLAVIECIQSGVAFIAAATGGIPEMVDAGVLFSPDPTSLAARLATRRAIDHDCVQHKYAAQTATAIWLDLHTEVLSGTASETGSLPPEDPHIPLVSVCIPFFNHQRYFQGLVAAFERQDYPALEVVVVNDGSSAEASQEFDRVAARCGDRRFLFHTTENQGPGAARNFAAEQASGELLIFFDADNVPIGPHFVRTLVRALRRSESDCVTSPYDIVGADRLFPSDRDVVATYRPIGPCIEAGFFENILGDTTSIITRAAFAGLGGFPVHREPLNTDGDGVRLSGQQRTWEDHEFLLNLCFRGGKLETFPEATFFYRQSPRSPQQEANDFQNYRSLFARLESASPEDLARIITAVGAPLLMSQPGRRMVRHVAL